ncbi:hypothetical protein B0H15DRAFT_952631 [Mycena belliarum]|uniref:Uncharacterized protein n=1 Tax=Mycena belliarum TaxID=1033014 RepID=A0AAD6U0W3_9AGAR|nr:hypothetical protein B0H15DRAFT_952631 [Mycena belliae]
MVGLSLWSASEAFEFYWLTHLRTTFKYTESCLGSLESPKAEVKLLYGYVVRGYGPVHHAQIYRNYARAVCKIQKQFRVLTYWARSLASEYIKQVVRSILNLLFELGRESKLSIDKWRRPTPELSTPVSEQRTHALPSRGRADHALSRVALDGSWHRAPESAAPGRRATRVSRARRPAPPPCAPRESAALRLRSFGPPPDMSCASGGGDACVSPSASRVSAAGVRASPAVDPACLRLRGARWVRACRGCRRKTGLGADEFGQRRVYGLRRGDEHAGANLEENAATGARASRNRPFARERELRAGAGFDGGGGRSTRAGLDGARRGRRARALVSR